MLFSYFSIANLSAQNVITNEHQYKRTQQNFSSKICT